MAEARIVWESVHIKIVPCPRCKGEGITRREECISYHNNDYETITELCTACDAEGRVLETFTHYKIEIDNSWIDHKTPTKWEKLNGRTTKDIYKIK